MTYEPTLKLFSTLFGPLKWLYELVSDQTRVELLVSAPEGWELDDTVPIEGGKKAKGVWLFGITTASKEAVELSRIEVRFRAPLQLTDPDQRGFFKCQNTLDKRFPFAIVWVGVTEVRHDTINAFAIQTKFPPGKVEQEVEIHVHAKRAQASIGGFIGHGRLRATTFRRNLRIVHLPNVGLMMPPGCSITSPQPFLIQGTATASGPVGAKAIVHERVGDDTVSTKKVTIRKR